MYAEIVLYRELREPLQRVRQGIRRLPGHPEHYISGNAVESRLPRLDNKFLRLLCVVEPPELFQLVILKRLHAYGNAVHACPP